MEARTRADGDELEWPLAGCGARLARKNSEGRFSANVFGPRLPSLRGAPVASEQGTIEKGSRAARGVPEKAVASPFGRGLAR
jgi:hypothetical protein